MRRMQLQVCRCSASRVFVVPIASARIIRRIFARNEPLTHHAPRSGVQQSVSTCVTVSVAKCTLEVRWLASLKG
jgi:hypothetical protein